MTQLVEALHTLGLDAEIDLAGRWARFPGERCPIYVVEAARGCYYTWCDRPGERMVQFYTNPVEAIRAGLGRAGRAGPEAGGPSDSG